MLILVIALSAQDPAVMSHPAVSVPHQSTFDADAERMSRGIKRDVSRDKGEPLTSRGSLLDRSKYPWRPVTDADMRLGSSYWSPVGYRFHRSARADMDHDGKPDTVEMVTNGRQRGLRITYAARGKPSRIVSRTDDAWSDEAIYPAGPHGVLINQPELNVYFVFQHGDDVRATFFGD